MNKKYRITIEKYAQKDIESIYNYICDNLVNKEAAIKLLNKINEKFDSIALSPKSAPLLNNDYVTNKNIRKLLIDNYITIMMVVMNLLNFYFISSKRFIVPHTF
jgi:plasmid stabilization system protein ParE